MHIVAASIKDSCQGQAWESGKHILAKKKKCADFQSKVSVSADPRCQNRCDHVNSAYAISKMVNTVVALVQVFF